MIRRYEFSALGERDEQQDVCATTPYCAIIADGMGGHEDGAAAAQAAVAAMLAELDERAQRDDIESAFSWACREVQSSSRGGTTLVLVCFETGIVAWVGDSRAYLVRAGEAEILTEDHAASDGCLIRWIPEEGVPEMVDVEFRPGDRVVLCTDGVSDMLDAATIARIASDEDEDPAQWMVEQALEHGASDNCTVVVCAFE